MQRLSASGEGFSRGLTPGRSHDGRRGTTRSWNHFSATVRLLRALSRRQLSWLVERRSCSRCRLIEWNRQNITLEDELYSRGLPLVAETWDGFLNDIYGQHVKQADVFAALNQASGGPVAEGNVGGGTGMTSFEFAGGIGTASRLVNTPWGEFTLGVLVQSNFGRRAELRIAGLPVGRQITDNMPEEGAKARISGNSIIVVIATDAPLIPTQLRRLARRATLGLGRVGSNGHSGSGDIFLAISSGNPMTAYWGKDINQLRMLPDLNPLFAAAVQATEEAIINAMVAGRSQSGADGNFVHGIPHQRLRELFSSQGDSVDPEENHSE